MFLGTMNMAGNIHATNTAAHHLAFHMNTFEHISFAETAAANVSPADWAQRLPAVPQL